MPNSVEIRELINRYISGRISAAEEELLFDWMGDSSKSELVKQVFEELIAERPTSQELELVANDTRIAEILSIDKALKQYPGRVFRLAGVSRWFKYAAILLVVIGVGASVWLLKREDNKSIVKTETQTDIKPGGLKAVLRLGDGTEINLDEVENGLISQRGSVRVVKTANGQIVYDVRESGNQGVEWNTVSTPVGGQFQIALPDGTMVWLNAASSIAFPSKFGGKERRVKVSGELYLDVAKNTKLPFLVDIGQQSVVEVLGTGFNINSYANENGIATTLVEGSVKINTSGKSTILSPGQQAVILTTRNSAEKSDIRIKTDLDISKVLAWKNGLFSFDNADLHSVMRQLERWYGIKVIYQGTATDLTLRGEMYRNVNLSTVLEFLEKMGVRFRLEGNILFVF